MIDDHTEHLDHLYEDLTPGGWNEFVAARGRFYAQLAAQSDSWVAARRLPARSAEGYDHPAADHGDRVWSQ